ncbi:MAG: transcription-repair coupling factor [Magnetococcales bacterium]|nr:transcription-repair coupling factor [Magnetococcales bacterium]
MDSSIIEQSVLDPIKPLLKRRGRYAMLESLPGGATAWYAAMLHRHLDGPLVLVTGKAARAEAIIRELHFFSRGLNNDPVLLSFPAWETLPFEPLSPYGPLVAERLSTLFRLTQMQGDGPITPGGESGHPQGIVVTTAAALMQKLMPRDLLVKNGFSITVGDQLDLPAFREFLTTTGYQNASQVSEPGEFSVRGGIVDFYPPGREDPVRIELFGDEVETMRLFNPNTQRSTDDIRELKALPVREVLLTQETITTFRTNYRAAYGGKASESDRYKSVSKGILFQGMEQFLPMFYEEPDTLFDYLPENALFLMEQDVLGSANARATEIQTRFQSVIEQSQHPDVTAETLLHPPPESLFLSREVLDEKIQQFPTLVEVSSDQEMADGITGFVPSINFHKDHDEEDGPISEVVAETMLDAIERGFHVGLVVRTVSQRERLREIMSRHKLPMTNGRDWQEVINTPPGKVMLCLGDVAQGFVYPAHKLALFTEGSIFGTRIHTRRKDSRYIDQLIASFADLNPADPVVHADHGIGRYHGLHTLEVVDVKNDFLLISYQDDDKLYVPVENLDRVSKYQGGDEPSLDKLGSVRWERTKQKAQKRIFEMAEELISLQALRASNNDGFQFSGPDPVYQEFAARFPYEETEDQATAILSVLEDMTKPKPMDRLVCGDVGFGKTEVALRAAFRAVMDGRQVAVLVPTTILAQQHYETFTHRFAAYPIRVGLLSRFRTPKVQKETLKQVAKGGIEVIIGTHRLLQKDVKFRDLGLLVVDEEQRFGVTHKERLKKMRANIDILTLTATPIPRTLHMAMSGVRDISIIASPPANRLSIRTFITQFERQKIRDAILREIYRGGQVFYVHNRVQDIEKSAAMISDLVPEAKVGVAHGQMRETQLEKVMLSFYNQEFNILVCTTIIENGVDIPSANTIIIHRADRFGLAQLHQLRGRVGRSKRRAYAYFLIPHPQALSSDARKRLEAIESLGELGSGFMLATHDLEIRGAGNLLGDSQSGQIKEVGFELYNQMLQDAVKNLQNKMNEEGDSAIKTLDVEPVQREIIPVINLHLSTYIPEDYVGDVHQRLTLYKRIAELIDPEEIESMRAELTDRFGIPPEPVENLLRIVGVKRLCRRLRIAKLEAGSRGGAFHFDASPRLNPGALVSLIQHGNGYVRFNQDTRILSSTNRSWDEPAKRVDEVVKILKQLQPVTH